MHCPPPRLCVDNGVMVAWTGVERLRLGDLFHHVMCSRDEWVQMSTRVVGTGLWEPPPCDVANAPLFVEVRPRWPLGPR
jgi:hypothetical protein